MRAYKTKVYNEMSIHDKINKKGEFILHQPSLKNCGCLVAFKSWGLNQFYFMFDWREKPYHSIN